MRDHATIVPAEAARLGRVGRPYHLLLVAGVISIAMAITALPVFPQYSHALALWFLALAVVNLSGLLVESVALRC